MKRVCVTFAPSFNFHANMQAHSRSQSPVREKQFPELSDEKYVKIIKRHNSDFSQPKTPITNLYIVMQTPKKNLFGECLTVQFTRYPSRLLWVALICLTTAQRDSELRNQPQTKKIAELVFGTIPTIRHDRIEKAKWFESLFPGFGEWTPPIWYDQFGSANDRVDGFMWNAPILETVFED